MKMLCVLGLCCHTISRGNLCTEWLGYTGPWSVLADAHFLLQHVLLLQPPHPHPQVGIHMANPVPPFKACWSSH
jgi:hypothetical protein